MIKYFVVALILIIILGVGAWFVLFSTSPTPDNGTSGEFPSSPSNGSLGQPSFPGNGGQPSQSNFTDELVGDLIVKEQAVQSPDEVTVTFVPQETDEEPPYVIFYVTSDDSFQIVLEEQPIGKVRRQAEAEFLSMTGLTESQACALRYQVVAPLSVDNTYGGSNLGFSFCPGSVTLTEI